MIKYCYILFFFIVSSAIAQDTLILARTENLTPAKKSIQIDTSAVEARHFKTDFQSHYKNADYQYEPKSQEFTAWQRFLKWLSNIFSGMFRSDGSKVSMNAIEKIFKVIVVIIIVVVIFLIVKSLMNKEGNWIFGKSSDKKFINLSEIEKNLRLVDFAKLIQDSTLAGEHRLSIRYYYLWLLKKMAAAELIEWDPEKTNSDYLYEIKNEEFRKEFGYLSYLYNHIWYGAFEIDEAAFEKAKKAFEKTIHQIR